MVYLQYSDAEKWLSWYGHVLKKGRNDCGNQTACADFPTDIGVRRHNCLLIYWCPCHFVYFCIL